jgi:hypothetical protein
MPQTYKPIAPAALALLLLAACTGEPAAPAGIATAKDRDDIVMITRPSGVEVYTAVDIRRNPVAKIAVLPFALAGGESDPVVRRKVEHQVSQTFRNRFGGLKLPIVDPGDVQGAIQAAGLSASRAVPAERQKDVASALGADAIVTGAITHFDMVYAAVYGQIAVGLDVAMTRPADGRTLWRAKYVLRQHKGAIPTTTHELIMTALGLGLDLDDKARAAVLEEVVEQIVLEAPNVAVGTAVASGQGASPDFAKAAAKDLRIVAASHSGAERALKIGDEVKFALAATAPAEVQAKIGGLTVTLRETPQRGAKGEIVFEGVHRVARNDKVEDQVAAFEAKAKDGTVATYVDPRATLTFDTDPPPPPAGLAARIADRRLKLTWTGVSVPDLAGYDIHRSATPLSGFVRIGTSEVAEFFDAEPLQPVGYYLVFARDRAGNLSDRLPPVEGRLISPGPTPVAGAIAEDTTWFAAASPYVLQGTISVPVGTTLRIEPGTVIQPRPGSRLVVQGQILAEGTQALPIAWDGEPEARWLGILFRGGQPGRVSTLAHNRLSGAENGIEIDGASPRILQSLFARNLVGLRVVSPISMPRLDANAFRGNETGALFDEADVEIANGVFRGNKVAIEANAAAPVVIGNDISGNGVAVLAKDQSRSSILPAQLNWWGGLDEGAIRGAVKGAVAYRPFLDAAPPAGKAVAARRVAEPPARAPDPPPADPFQGLMAAAKAMDEGRIEDAIRGFEAVAPVAPRNADLQYRLALLHFQSGAPGQALAAIERAIAINAYAPHFHMTHATILRDRGDIAGVRRALGKVIELKPADAAAAAMLVSLGQSGS